MAGVKRFRNYERAAKRMKYVKKTMKRRYSRKRVTKNKNTAAIGKGFPKKMLITHKYNDVQTVTCTTGVLQHYLFSCNGMFDPNITGTGHQPLYFDQMATIYDHYTVIGSKITLRVSPAATNEETFVCGLFKNDDTTQTITDITGVGEQSSGKTRMVAPNAVTTFVFSSKWSAKKTFGGSVLGNDNLQGTATANPTEQTYYDFVIQSVGAVTTACVIDAHIEYIAIWDELRDIAQS